MSFNVVATVEPVGYVEATGGVRSIVVRWSNPADYTHIEVWASETDDFSAANLVEITQGNAFTETDLDAYYDRYYFVRAAKEFSPGDIKYSEPMSAYGYGLPIIPENNSVLTQHVVDNAITERSTFERNTTLYCFTGQNSPAGSEIETDTGITFIGTGEEMVITCIARASETPVDFVGPGTCSATGSATIVRVGDDVEVEYAEMTLASINVSTMAVSPNPIALGINRDFYHNFIFRTDPGEMYKVDFRFWTFVDNEDNYILWASDHRQVIWQEFKR